MDHFGQRTNLIGSFVSLFGILIKIVIFSKGQFWLNLIKLANLVKNGAFFGAFFGGRRR